MTDQTGGIKVLKNKMEYIAEYNQFVIFEPLSYCFKETIEFDVKASFASRPVSRLIR